MAFQFVGIGALQSAFAEGAAPGSDTQTVVMPVGVADGDLVLLIAGFLATGSPDDGHSTWSVGAGAWTVVADDVPSGTGTGASDKLKVTVLSHVASSEPANYSVTCQRDGGNIYDPAAALVVYRSMSKPGVGDYQTANASSGSTNVATLDVTLPSMATPLGADGGLVYLWWGNGFETSSDTTFSTPTGVTLDASMDWDTGVGSNKNIRVYSEGLPHGADFPSRTSTLTTTGAPEVMTGGALRVYATATLASAPDSSFLEVSPRKVGMLELPYHLHTRMGMGLEP